MATAVWDLELPQSWSVEPDEVEPVDNRVRFTPDAGPAKLAVLTSAGVEVYRPGPMLMGESQYRRLLDVFWVTTLAGGTQPFDWTDPWPGAGTLRFRFRSKPTRTGVTRPQNLEPRFHTSSSTNPERLVRVQMELERLPFFPT